MSTASPMERDTRTWLTPGSSLTDSNPSIETTRRAESGGWNIEPEAHTVALHQPVEADGNTRGHRAGHLEEVDRRHLEEHVRGPATQAAVDLDQLRAVGRQFDFGVHDRVDDAERLDCPPGHNGQGVERRASSAAGMKFPSRGKLRPRGTDPSPPRGSPCPGRPRSPPTRSWRKSGSGSDRQAAALRRRRRSGQPSPVGGRESNSSYEPACWMPRLPLPCAASRRPEIRLRPPVVRLPPSMHRGGPLEVRAGDACVAASVRWIRLSTTASATSGVW